jgi:glutamate synthase domain-containing protein 3
VALSLEPYLIRAAGHRSHPGWIPIERPLLSKRIAAEAAPAIEQGTPVVMAYPITNEDRTIGATVSGDITRRWGPDGLPDGTITIRLAGTAGQSFGAWLSPGISLQLDGTANDYVGKGMAGGRTAIIPRRVDPRVSPHGAGNAVMYGATGGLLMVAGTVGQRFAVRNSGGVAAVEGVGDHGCEYMTGGRVVILGRVGRNFAAGMTGGVAFVWDPDKLLNRLVSDTAPAMRRLSEVESIDLRELVDEFATVTRSGIAAMVLDTWDEQIRSFWVLRAGGSSLGSSSNARAASSVG